MSCRLRAGAYGLARTSRAPSLAIAGKAADAMEVGLLSDRYAARNGGTQG